MVRGNKMGQIDWAKNRLIKSKSAIEAMAKVHSPSTTRILLCSHLEAKFVAFAFLLKDQGFNVSLVSNLPTSLKREFVEEIKAHGITFYDSSDLSFQDSEELIYQIVNQNQFDFIFDDGGHTYSKFKNANPNCFCTEFTQSGINLAQEKGVKVPLVNLNSSLTKGLIGNVHGTGISALTAIQTITNISFHKINVGIIGFGPVGLSCALSFKGANSIVHIYDINQNKKDLAQKHGLNFEDKDTLLRECDLIITCTGRSGVISPEDFSFLKEGCILANVGHYNHEILLPSAASSKNITDDIEEYSFNGKSVFLLSKGNLVNLAYGQGYPVQIIDLSFAAAIYGWMHSFEKKYPIGLHEYPKEIDESHFSEEIDKYKF